MSKRCKKLLVSSESKALKKLRITHGISIRKLADMVGVSHTLVGYYEQGRANITDEYVQKFLKALELTYEDWLFEIGQKEESSESLRSNCHELLDQISPSKMEFVFQFLSQCKS